MSIPEVYISELRLPQEVEAIVDFLHSDFLFTEPLNAALHTSAKESREVDEGENASLTLWMIFRNLSVEPKRSVRQ